MSASARARDGAPSPTPPDSLGEALARRIGAAGAIGVGDFMDACLNDAEHGYYRVREPLGREGDFITAPEVSQIFGELIGLWAVETWRAMGAPDAFSLIELGPGRGTLMADALRASRIVPGFHRACSLHLVETSAPLRAAQESSLGDLGLDVSWHDGLEDVPPGPAIVIANEFVDALPIRQVVRVADGWRERCVVLTEAGAFAFGVHPSPAQTPAGAPADAAEGDIFEVRPGAQHAIDALAQLGAVHPMAALIIDYGHLASACGDTLQAVRRHRRADPLEGPGETDLTAHVDFAALARSAAQAGLTVWGPLDQGAFLLSLGLAQRCERLAAAGGEASERVLGGAKRLVEAGQMGTLFKIIALATPSLPAPPAFERAWRFDGL